MGKKSVVVYQNDNGTVRNAQLESVVTALICAHAEPLETKPKGQVLLCMDCLDALDAGAQLVDEAGRPVWLHKAAKAGN
jgi:hypothetical protein